MAGLADGRARRRVFRSRRLHDLRHRRRTDRRVHEREARARRLRQCLPAQGRGRRVRGGQHRLVHLPVSRMGLRPGRQAGRARAAARSAALRRRELPSVADRARYLGRLRVRQLQRGRPDAFGVHGDRPIRGVGGVPSVPGHAPRRSVHIRDRLQLETPAGEPDRYLPCRGDPQGHLRHRGLRGDLAARCNLHKMGLAQGLSQPEHVAGTASSCSGRLPGSPITSLAPASLTAPSCGRI